MGTVALRSNRIDKVRQAGSSVGKSMRLISARSGVQIPSCLYGTPSLWGASGRGGLPTLRVEALASTGGIRHPKGERVARRKNWPSHPCVMEASQWLSYKGCKRESIRCGAFSPAFACKLMRELIPTSAPVFGDSLILEIEAPVPLTPKKPHRPWI